MLNNNTLVLVYEIVVFYYLKGGEKMVTEAQRKAINKWNKENLKQINLQIKIDEYNEIKQYCKDRNMPVNTFVRSCVQSVIHGENLTMVECIGAENFRKLSEMLQAENRDIKGFFGSAVQKYIDNHTASE